MGLRLKGYNAAVSPLEHSLSAPSARVSLRAELPYAAAILAWFIGAAFLTAGRDVPVIDDWTYAWSVEHLLRTGQFDVLDFSAVYPFSLTLWGAAWASLLGFSFAALRLSTLVLGFVASVAVYLILRELRAPKGLSLLGAFVVAANPMFFVLAASFMTDVPFVACTMMALLCYVRAGSRGHVNLIWWAGLWGLAALLIRQIGVITPVAGLPLLLHSRHARTTLPRRHVMAALAATWVAMALSGWVLTTIVAPTPIMGQLGGRLNSLLLVPAIGYLAATLKMVTFTAFHALPALLAMASARGLWRATHTLLAAAVGAVILLAIVGDIPQPLQPGSIWSVRELGLPRALVRGEWSDTFPTWLTGALRGAGLLAVALGLTALVLRLRCSRRPPVNAPVDVAADVAQRHPPACAAIASSHCAPVVMYLVVYVVLANVLWFYHDRYWLPVLFAFVIIAVGRSGSSTRVPTLAWSVVTVFAVIAIVGTRDTLHFNQAVRDTSQALVASGVPQSDIDAGYSWNGWMLYAHPENLAAGQRASRDVPWVSTMRMTPYVLATSPLSDYLIERVITWDDLWWPNADRLYVLKRQPPARYRLRGA